MQVNEILALSVLWISVGEKTGSDGSGACICVWFCGAEWSRIVVSVKVGIRTW